jgi:hypothetical protein
MFTTSKSAMVLLLFGTAILLAAGPPPALKDSGIEFRFDSMEGSLTNKFGFNPETKSWTSLIRQEENGQWQTFAEEKWTRK